MLSPGTAYLLAYLPAHRLAHAARKDLLERNAATTDPKLKQAIEFSRHALKVEDSSVAETDRRVSQLAAQNGLTSPDATKAKLTTALLHAAWKAGETAGRVLIAVKMAVQIAHLRNAAPENAELRAQAEQQAKDLKAGAAQLTEDLNATGLPLVMDLADNVADQISLTRNLTPTTPGGYRELNMLVRDIDKFIELKVEALDTPPPPPGSPPTASEWNARLRSFGARDVKVTAGVPAEVTIDAQALLARGKDLLAAAPVRRLKVRNAKGRVADVVRSPLLAAVEALDLDEQGVTDEDIIALAASPHASRLTQLDARFNVLTERGIEALAASPHLKELEVVNLEPNQLDPVDRIEYYNETNTHYVPTEAGKALEAKYGRLRWLHRR